MSNEFISYASIAMAAWLVALLLVKPRNAIDLSRCAGWYLLVFFATYILRPATTQLIGDVSLYQWLKIGHFEDHWQLMAIASPTAILSFGIGYALTAAFSRRSKPTVKKELPINPSTVRMLIYFAIGLGYLSLLVSLRTGTLGGDAGDYAGAAVGVYEHNTAWFAQDDLFISTGSILYYIVTGHLAMSLLIALPWMFCRILFGWGRAHLLGHFFALLAIYFLKAHQFAKSGTKSSQSLTIGGAILIVLMLFPFLGALRTLKGQLRMNSSTMSKEALTMVGSQNNAEDLLQSYMGTNSTISGFEQSLSHLINDSRPDLGSQYLYFYIFKPIPRIIWPGKGNPYSWQQRLRGIEPDPLLTIIGALPGAIGMAYQSWGWAGIPFEFFLTGLLLRKIEDMARRRPNALHVQLGYAGFYSMLPESGRDSIFYLIAIVWLFQYGIFFLILWRISRNAASRVRARRMAPVLRPAIASDTGA